MSGGRSYAPITEADLTTLGRLAATDRERFFLRRPEYKTRLVCVALCQGAGLHYVNITRGQRPNGVKDFDVWSFFAALPGQRFPADRRMTHADLGESKFGRWDHEPDQFRHFRGRRVDFLVRALPVPTARDPVQGLVAYLHERRTATARQLALKGTVLIDPSARRGEIVWPPTPTDPFVTG